jgi:hypothetical protein
LLIDAVCAVNSMLFFIGAPVPVVIGFMQAKIVFHLCRAQNQAAINGKHRRDLPRWNLRVLAGYARSGTVQKPAQKYVSMKALRTRIQCRMMTATIQKL